LPLAHSDHTVPHREGGYQTVLDPHFFSILPLPPASQLAKPGQRITDPGPRPDGPAFPRLLFCGPDHEQPASAPPEHWGRNSIPARQWSTSGPCTWAGLRTSFGYIIWHDIEGVMALLAVAVIFATSANRAAAGTLGVNDLYFI